MIVDKSIKTVVSGITPSGGGTLHLGNYFGAIKPHLELQTQIDKAYYFVADLHALTTIKDHKTLEHNILNVVLDYLAFGFDPEKTVYFRQSDVHEHSELAIILSNFTSYGQMKRMHAFKDKLQKGLDTDSINMGLFSYSILMTADILLYNPDGVPVGADQKQHVEVARDIVESFNKAYKTDFFKLPKPLIEAKKISRLVGTDGQRKMSKSLGNIISIFDSEEVIKKQIMSCYTDPSRRKASDPGKVEGNPVFLYHDLLNKDKKEVLNLKNRYKEGKVGDVEVKEKLVKAHLEYFKEARERRAYLASNPKLIREILESGAKQARQVSAKTMEKVKKLIGLSIPL